jgi:2,4-dienoyl-CoA reductase (NADPH2)
MIFPRLFSPAKIGGIEVRNRLVMPAMHTNLGDPQDGISREGMDFYVARARGGFGQVGVGIIDSFQFGHASPGEFVLQNSRHVGVHARLVKELKAAGTLAFAQIGLRRIWSLHEMRRKPKLSEFTSAEIQIWVQAVVDTATRALDAGYDAIDLLGNGGGAISIFLSQVFNDREDEWGGDEDRRAAFPVAIVRGIREQVSADVPIFSRLHGAEFLAGGYGLDTAIRNADRLAKAGVGLFNVAAGGHATTVPNLTPDVPESGFAFLSNAIKRAGVPARIAASTRISEPFSAEEILRKGWADYISLARPALADPDWPNKAMNGDWDDIRLCIACNECLDAATVREETVRCLVNPRAGRHSEIITVPRAATRKMVFVVGGGCVGLQAAITAAERGHEVHLYEKQNYLGGKWLVSYAPPGREPLASFLTWLVRRAKSVGVEIHLSTAVTPELLRQSAPDEVIATIGATPVMPDIPGIDSAHVVTGEQVLMGEVELGTNVVVAGGGGAGVEVAHFIATMHQLDHNLVAHLESFDGYLPVKDQVEECRRNVTLLGRNRRVGTGLGPATRWVLVHELTDDGVDVKAGYALTAIGPNSVITTDMEDGGETEIAADSVVICAGYRADPAALEALRTAAPDLHALGDAKSIGHAMIGIAEAYDLAITI